MNNKHLIPTALMLLTVTMLFNCQISGKNSENLKKNEVGLNDSIAKTDTVNNSNISDSFQKFKIEAEDIINDYTERIATLKEKIASEKTENKTKYEEKLALLEQKNKALKTKLVNFKDKEIDDWDQLQAEFKKDLDELGKAITDFFVKGV
jgi:hypothetical protein